jgi:hypothetical protein
MTAVGGSEGGRSAGANGQTGKNLPGGRLKFPDDAPFSAAMIG